MTKIKNQKDQSVQKLIEAQKKQIINLKKKNKNLNKINKNLNKKVAAQKIIIKSKNKSISDEYKKNFRFCKKIIYSQYDKSQSIYKLKRLKNKSVYQIANKLKALISNIQINNKRQKKNIKKKYSHNDIQSIINVKIGDKIKEDDFLDCVKKSIDKINSIWPKNMIILIKNELDGVNISKKDFDSESPLSNLKKDVLIDLLLNPNFKINSNDIKILKVKNCCTKPLTNGIKFINPKDQREYIFDKKFIKHKILNNIGIINSFYKMLQKYTDTKFMKIDKLKKKIEKMIDNTNIYFSDLPTEICGVTISTGDIYISSDYLMEALGKTDEALSLTKEDKQYYILTAICKIYLTLLHEFAHKLHYIVRKDKVKLESENWKKNFFIRSEESSINIFDYYSDIYGNNNNINFINKNSNIHKNSNNESGDFFDEELYDGEPFKEIIHNTINFFLFERCSYYEKYIKNINNLRLDTFNTRKKRDSNSKFKISGANIFPKCYFSAIRNY